MKIKFIFSVLIFLAVQSANSQTVKSDPGLILWFDQPASAWEEAAPLGEIKVLPALPDEWQEGSVEGLKTRGGFTISVEWENGKLKKMIVHSGLGGNCRLMAHSPVKVLETSFQRATSANTNPLMRAQEIPVLQNHSGNNLQMLEKNTFHGIDFRTEERKTYTVVPL